MSNLMDTIDEAMPKEIPFDVNFCDENTFPKDKVIAWEEVNGKRLPRVYWSDVVKCYPDTWVGYQNIEHCGGKRLFSAVIISVFVNGERQRAMYELMKNGFKVTSQRTDFF